MKIPSRDICWLEAIAVELASYILEAKGIGECMVIVHSDNEVL
jgi:hypothetical protein